MVRPRTPRPPAGPVGTPPAPTPATGRGGAAPGGVVPPAPVAGSTVTVTGTTVHVHRAATGTGATTTAARARCTTPGCGRFALAGGNHCAAHAGSGGIPVLRHWRWILGLLGLIAAIVYFTRGGGIPSWFTPPVTPSLPAAPIAAPKPVPPPPPVPSCKTTIQVVAFYDMNGNGGRDIGEPLLSGFQFRVIETGTVGTTNSGGAEKLEATPRRQYTIVIEKSPAPWVIAFTSSKVAAAKACEDLTVSFASRPLAAQTPVPALAPSPTAAPTVTPKPTIAPTVSPAPVPTAAPTATPTPAPKVEDGGVAGVRWTSQGDGYVGSGTASAWKLVNGVKVSEGQTTFSVPLTPACTTASGKVTVPLSDGSSRAVGWQATTPCPPPPGR